MTGKSTPNDDLGDWGESQFRALCSAASLVANKAERDKMGWDFLVELPPEAATIGAPVDQRPNRLGCRVQVKTHWRRKNDRFAMTLSAAQRLAQEPGPSFILVLAADRPTDDEDPKLVCCHLIHMLGNNLERVLKRLRESAADPAAELDEEKISFSPRLAGDPLPPKGSAIRDALISACGADAQAYIARKGEQLKDLGYTAGRYQLNTTITADSPEEYVEMLLGLRPVCLERLDAYDTRFGVPIPVDHIPAGAAYEMRFQPHPAATCTIRIRGMSLAPAAVFDGEVFLPVMRVPDQYLRILIKTPFFTFDSRAGGKTDFNLDAGALFNADLRLDEWRHYLRFLEILGEGKLELDVEVNDPVMPRVTAKMETATPAPQEPWVASLADVVRRAEALLKFAGAKAGATSLGKLEEAAEMVNLAFGRLYEPAEVAPQTFQSSGQLPPHVALVDLEFLQADYVVIAGVTLAYACRVTMRPEAAGTGILWRQVDIKPERLAIIDKAVEAFKAFIADAQERTGLENTMIRDLNREADDSADEPVNC